MCGSFGKGVEGQLLACAQCAQCYHPYCVNSKVRTALNFRCAFFTVLCQSIQIKPSIFADYKDEAS